MPAPKPLRTAGRRQASDRPSSHYDQLNEIQAFAWSIVDTEAGYAREINDRLGYRLKVYGCPMHSAFGAAMGAGKGARCCVSVSDRAADRCASRSCATAQWNSCKSSAAPATRWQSPL